MTLPDKRVHAFRPDLADVSLRHIVSAHKYVEPSLRQCVKGVVPLLDSPSPVAGRISEIRYGEFLDVFEERADGFAWVQNRSDRYVGYIHAQGALSDEIAALSNRVKVLHSFIYSDPDCKSPAIDRITLGSYVRVAGEQGQFMALVGGGYVFSGHIAPTWDTVVHDYAFTAGSLLGSPYLWGGRTPLGIDCSGLVQLALEMAGIESPRDSDQQLQAFGQPLPAHWHDVAWKRGDLVFFQGHVGIMASPSHIVHANAFSMRVTSEPLSHIIERGNEILAAGRPAPVAESSAA